MKAEMSFSVCHPRRSGLDLDHGLKEGMKMMSVFLYNRDTDSVSEILKGADTGSECLKLSIVDGKRVKTPGKLFVAGDFTDNSWFNEESRAWSIVERLAAEKTAAKAVK
jgi:hypothetical protein